MKSWKTAVRALVRAIERSTWASPRTARRTVMPAACRERSSPAVAAAGIGPGRAGGVFREMAEERGEYRCGPFRAREVGGAGQLDESSRPGCGR